MNALKKAVIAGDHFDKTIYTAIGTFPILYSTIWQYTIYNSMRLQEKLQHAILFDGYGWEMEMDSWQRWFMWCFTYRIYWSFWLYCASIFDRQIRSMRFYIWSV